MTKRAPCDQPTLVSTHAQRLDARKVRKVRIHEVGPPPNVCHEHARVRRVPSREGALNARPKVRVATAKRKPVVRPAAAPRKKRRARGCVRMRNADLITLFDRMAEGDRVFIYD